MEEDNTALELIRITRLMRGLKKGGKFMNTPLKKIVNLKAELLSNGVVHSGIIENIMKNVLYVRAVSKRHSSDLAPGKVLSVNVQVDSGDTVCLECKVKWSYKTPPYGITESLGMEVIRPAYYSELLQAL